jgi:predicted Zn-dependent protease
MAFLAAIVLLASPAVATPSAISPQERNWEVQVGEETYATYAQRGELVSRQSRLYAILDPVANAVASVANREYYARFHFILLNEAQPNAFSMPGGDVYVTTALLSYLRNRDELAGVLCHEVSHDIHHDMYNIAQVTEHGLQPIAYERAAETNADRTGAYICARAKFNPWGMVWNMRLRRGTGESQQVTSTSDHPSDAQRVDNLTALLRSDPAAFGKFKDDVVASVPLGNASAFARTGYAAAYPAQRQMQYPAQYPSQYQYPAQYQYPSQYQTQYPAQYQYPVRYPAQNQYPAQYQSPSQMGPYPAPPPPPACYPGC